jgi:hypothetical protein
MLKRITVIGFAVLPNLFFALEKHEFISKSKKQLL